MSTLRRALCLLNKLLVPLNLHLDTMTGAKVETQRLRAVERADRFDGPVYPLPSCFERSRHDILLGELAQHRARFDSFRFAEGNLAGFQFGNGFFNSPDVEILYAMVRTSAPRRVIEVGCGHSTKIIHQAICDGNLESVHTAIDPQPRQEISVLVREMLRQPVEFSDAVQRVRQLEPNDILFIDTSHEVRPANDVAFIYGVLLDAVPPGVNVHLHDIFIPYEYPRSCVLGEGLRWGEQYLVQAMLAWSDAWDVLWPGYYLQQTQRDFQRHFPHWSGGLAQSLWLQRR